MRESFWKKIEEAKKKGISLEDFERVESLESAIAYHQMRLIASKRKFRPLRKGQAPSQSDRWQSCVNGGQSPPTPLPPLLDLDYLDF